MLIRRHTYLIRAAVVLLLPLGVLGCATISSDAALEADKEFTLARQYFDVGEFVEARTHVNKALNHNPAHSHALDLKEYIDFIFWANRCPLGGGN